MKLKNYDYLIVGAGLFGAVFAREATDAGKTCLVIEKRDHIAGNCYDEPCEGISVHKYGAHIFHTSNEKVWNYVNRFAKFNNYVNSPVARYHNELYNMPFNMNTFSKLWGVQTPQEAKAKIAEQIAATGITEPKNLEEQALSMVGPDVYKKLVKEYTEKQWGRDCKDLPAFIIKRLPLRFTFDNNYFNDPHQGIPTEGYTAMVENMLSGIEVLTGTEYREFIKKNPNIAKKTVYTGLIDEFFDFSLGELEYRSLRFENEVLDEQNFQGCAVVNYTSHEVSFTRIIEHKHFEYPPASAAAAPKTIITREYPAAWSKGCEPYYPINDDKNGALYEKYEELAKSRPDVIFGGRLGMYRYFDMDKVIAAALECVESELAN